MCVLQTRLRAVALSLARSLLSHTHTARLRRRRRWRRQRDSLLFSLRQKDLRPPCFCLDESATQRSPEAAHGTARGSSEGKSQRSPSKQFLAGNNRLLSPLRAHLQCAANFTQSRAEREEGEGREGRKKKKHNNKKKNGYYRLFQGEGRETRPPRRARSSGRSPLRGEGGRGGLGAPGRVTGPSRAPRVRGERRQRRKGVLPDFDFRKSLESPGPRCSQGQEISPDGVGVGSAVRRGRREPRSGPGGPHCPEGGAEPGVPRRTAAGPGLRQAPQTRIFLLLEIPCPVIGEL